MEIISLRPAETEELAALRAQVEAARRLRDKRKAASEAANAEYLRLSKWTEKRDEYGEIVQVAAKTPNGVAASISHWVQGGLPDEIEFAHNQATRALEDYRVADTELDALREKLMKVSDAAIAVEAVEMELAELVARDESLLAELFAACNQLRVVVRDWNAHVKAKLKLRAFLVARNLRADGGMTGPMGDRLGLWVMNEFIDGRQLKRQLTLMAHGQGQHTLMPTAMHHALQGLKQAVRQAARPHSANAYTQYP